MDNEKFGKFIAELRKEKNMTQKEMAEQFHITNKAISKWERGLSFPDISMLKPLAEFFGVTILELLNGEREKAQEIDIETKIIMILKKIEKEKNRKIAKVIGISFSIMIITAIIFFVLAFSKVELHTYNPIRAIIGYVQITKGNKEYVEVGNIPLKTIYAGANFSIEQYMKDKGYEKLEELTIKSGDDFYSNGETVIFISSWHRKGIAIYEWESKTPYHETIEEKQLETEIKVPTLNEIEIKNETIEIPIINIEEQTNRINILLHSR